MDSYNLASLGMNWNGSQLTNVYKRPSRLVTKIKHPLAKRVFLFPLNWSFRGLLISEKYLLLLVTLRFLFHMLMKEEGIAYTFLDPGC